jgi:hypothetical protein
MVLGSHRAIPGNTVSRRITPNDISTNGIAPLKISAIVASFVILDKINTFKPTGGVISAISVRSTKTIPNHTGSKPR